MLTSTEYDVICSKIKALCEELGAFMLIEQQKISDENVEVKSINSLVTYVDKTVEEKIVKELRLLIPDCGFITEEETASDDTKEYVWVIDPLDGTTNYIHGIPCFGISIGLMRSRKLIIGCIYEANRKEFFHAHEHSVAFMNGKEISVSNSPSLKDSLIATGFPYYDYKRSEEYLKLFSHLMKNSRGLRRLGSAAIDLAYVACGRFDSFYEYSLHPWDVAAGAFIVEKAGGKVSDFRGGNDYLFGKEIIAANSNTFEELLSNVKSYFS